jgi:hypothetical protein
MNPRQFLIERKRRGPGSRALRDIFNGNAADVPRGWKIIRELTR